MPELGQAPGCASPGRCAFPGERPGAAGTAGTRRARRVRACPRRNERARPATSGRAAQAASRPAGDAGRGGPVAGRRARAVRHASVLLRRVHARQPPEARARNRACRRGQPTRGQLAPARARLAGNGLTSRRRIRGRSSPFAGRARRPSRPMAASYPDQPRPFPAGRCTTRRAGRGAAARRGPRRPRRRRAARPATR